MTPEDTRFVQFVEQAIRSSLASFAAHHPGSTLTGYAISTDDCLCTIFCAFADSAFLAAPPYAGAGFIFVEWPYGDKSGSFEKAQSAIAQRYQAAHDGGYFDAHVDTTFACIAEALRRSRDDGVLGPEVFAFAGSTDPSDHLESLALRVAGELNAPGLVDGMRKAFGL